MTPDRLPLVDRDLMARAMTLAERSNWESNAASGHAERAGDGAVDGSSSSPPYRNVPAGAPMTKEPRVNLDRLVANIVLDCSLLGGSPTTAAATKCWPRSPCNEPGPRTPRAKSWTSWSGTAAAGLDLDQRLLRRRL
jgi:hypothetical protein